MALERMYSVIGMHQDPALTGPSQVLFPMALPVSEPGDDQIKAGEESAKRALLWQMPHEARVEGKVIQGFDLVGEPGFSRQGQPERVAHEGDPAMRKVLPKQVRGRDRSNEVSDATR
jgi:hypothetical protein